MSNTCSLHLLVLNTSEGERDNTPNCDLEVGQGGHHQRGHMAASGRVTAKTWMQALGPACCPPRVTLIILEGQVQHSWQPSLSSESCCAGIITRLQKSQRTPSGWTRCLPRPTRKYPCQPASPHELSAVSVIAPDFCKTLCPEQL